MVDHVKYSLAFAVDFNKLRNEPGLGLKADGHYCPHIVAYMGNEMDHLFLSDGTVVAQEPNAMTSMQVMMPVYERCRRPGTLSEYYRAKDAKHAEERKKKRTGLKEKLEERRKRRRAKRIA